MRAFQLLLCVFFFLPVRQPASVPPQQATPTGAVIITYPQPGQALQGDILITGTTLMEGFAAYEVAFAYAQDPTDTWFLLQYSDQPIANAVLTHWDTTIITDGDYALRLIVFFVDGSQVTVTVEGLRVRNYSPIETETPTPLPPSSTPAPGTPLPPSPTPTITATPTQTPVPPTPTPLPTNPAIISQRDVVITLAEGAGIGIGFLVSVGAIVTIRHWTRHRR